MTAQPTHMEPQARTTEPVTPAGRARLREACHAIHLTSQEMDYAARRVVELRAPSSVDTRRNGR
jgi:hypothetical protein